MECSALLVKIKHLDVSLCFGLAKPISVNPPMTLPD